VVSLAVSAGAAQDAWSCQSDDDCAPPTPICDLACVQCLLDFHCPAATPHCNFVAAACEGCSSDEHCSSYPSLPACTASGACGECSASNQALCSGSEPVCDTPTSSCVPCSTNADCSGNPDGPICLAGGACGTATASCGGAPAGACNLPGGSSVRLLRGIDPAGKLLLWKWSYGMIVPGDFGDPVFSTNFALCIYRDGAPIFSAGIHPSASFWKQTSSGFKFSYPLANPDGILKMNLRSGFDDAKITVKGKGANLDLPALPMGGSVVVVQLVGDAASGSPCWGAEFAAPYREDDGETFKTRTNQ